MFKNYCSSGDEIGEWGIQKMWTPLSQKSCSLLLSGIALSATALIDLCDYRKRKKKYNYYEKNKSAFLKVDSLNDIITCITISTTGHIDNKIKQNPTECMEKC